MPESSKVVQIFDPQKVPYRGMKSDLSGLALNSGEFLLGQNIRIGDRTIRSRWGLAKTGSSPAVNPLHATAYCVGAKTVQANGTVYAISAWRATSGVTGTWIYTQNLTTGAWSSAINAASGAYGDTTGATGAYFATDTYTPVDFFTLKDPRTGLEYIVCLGDSGTGIYDPTNSTFALIANSGGGATVAPPQDTSGFTTKPTFPVYFAVNNASKSTPTNSDTDWAVADSGASTTDNYWTLTRSNTGAAAANSTAEMTLVDAVNLSASRQLVILYDSAVPDFWEGVKISVKEGGTGGTPYTVWDPSTSNYRPEYVPVENDRVDTKMVVAFNLDHIASANLDAVDTLVFTYLSGTTPTTAKVCNIYMIAGSGKVIGNSYHAVTYMDTAARVESQPVFPKVLPEFVSNLGGATSAVLGSIRLPFSPSLFYTYTVGYQNTSSATQVNKVNIYRLDPGDPDETRYSYVTTQTITSYSGSWAFSSGSALSILTYSDTTVSSSRNLKVLAPFPGCRAMPSGCFAGASLGERGIFAKWVGGGAYNAPSFSELWISEDGNPFRYYEAPYQGDPLSGGKMQTSGEVIYGFAKIATGGYGFQSLITFTDKNVYRSFGPTIQSLLQLGLVTQHGTKYRESIATYKDSVFWMDFNQDVLKLSGSGLQNLTRHVVNGQFSTVLPTSPYLINNAQAHKVSAAYYRNRYHIAYDTVGSDTTSSMRKTKAMVYDDEYNVWTQDAWANSLATQFLFLADSKLYAIGAARYTYTLEDGTTTTDDSTAYSVSLTTGALHADFQLGWEVTRCWALLDDSASGTASWTATYMPDNSTRTSGSKSVDVSTTYVLRELRATGGTGRGAGVVASIAFTFTVPGGTRIYGVSAELKPVPLTPTAV